MVELIGLAATVSGLTGYNIRDVISWLHRRQSPAKLMAVTTAKLLAMLMEPADELTGRWHVSQWRYLWRSGPIEKWEESPFHVDGRLYVVHKFPDEARWKCVLVLDYSPRRTRKSWVPSRLRDFYSRRHGQLFTGVYDVEIREDVPGIYSGSSTMVFRSPDLGSRYSGAFTGLALGSDGVLRGKFRNSNPLPAPMPDGMAEVAFQQRTRWDELVGETQGLSV